MARVFIRGFHRSRSSLISQPTLIYKPNAASSSSYKSSLKLISENPKSFIDPQTLNLFETCHNMRQLFQIQAHLITSGLFRNTSLAGRVLKHSADFAGLEYTILIFRCIGSPDAFCINTVIKAYGCSSVPHQAVVFYFEMLREGFLPNSFTFPPLINSCAKMNCSKIGGKCHGQATKNGVDNELHVQNSLIHLYACLGLLHIAVKVFAEMSVRDLVSWNAIVDGFAKYGDLDGAHQLFDAMPHRNVISWNIMIAWYVNCGNPGYGLKLFRHMVKKGLNGSNTTMVIVLTACGRSARLKEGRSVHGSFIRKLGNPSLIINTALIDMYGRCGRVDIAKLVFDKMPTRNLVSWNAMILGHCIHGNPEDGLNLYAEMVRDANSEEVQLDVHESTNPDEEKAFVPDEITFIGILCACARAELLEEGKNYFHQMTDVFGIKPNFAHYWCMANLFSSVGLMRDAEELLMNVPVDEDMSPESSLWAGLLGSSRFQGNVMLGERIAKTLIELEPHNISRYRLLLNVYAVAGQWEDVARVKETMKERGLRRIPGCSLFDLKEIIHGLKLGDKCRENIPVTDILIDDSETKFIDNAS